MTLPLSPAQRNVLVGCALLLAAILYAIAAPITPASPRAIHLAARKSFAAPPAFVMPAPDRYAIIDTRPLFLPSRGPINTPDTKTQTAAAAGPPPLPDVTLVGVILDSDTKLAMVKTSGAAFAQSVAVGATLGGWSVSEIDADKIVLRAPGFADQVLSMNAAPKAAGTPQPQQQGLSRP